MQTTLNPRYRDFAQAYVLGGPGVRGNACAAYKAAGFKPKNDHVARAAGQRLLTFVTIQQEIARLYFEQDAQRTTGLQEWRTLAPDAQRRVLLIAMGMVPDPDAARRARPIRDREDAACARVILDANLAILERAYPAKIYHSVELHNPDAVLASILGIPLADLPRPETLYAPPVGVN